MKTLYHLFFLAYHEWRGARTFEKINRTEDLAQLWRAEIRLCHHNDKLRYHQRMLS